MNNLQRRAAKVAEEAKAETRYVSGTEPKSIQKVKLTSNSKRNRDTGQSVLDELRDSLR